MNKKNKIFSADKLLQKCTTFLRRFRLSPHVSHLTSHESGASMLEMMLVIALVLALAPYMYYRITETGRDISDIGIARKITEHGAPIMNYVRLNQDFWTSVAQIELSAEELEQILADAGDGSENPRLSDPRFRLSGAFIHKYKTSGGASFDIYLEFEIKDSDEMRNTRIARAIGGDAGIARGGAADGVYGNWTVRSDIFQDGNIVYRVSENLSTQDAMRFLHRTVLGDEALNKMHRNLSLGGNMAYNIGSVLAESARVSDAAALFADADIASAKELVFPSGANIDPTNARFYSIRVLGDVTGFRNIAARKFSGRGTGTWPRQGTIVTDRANISDSVHVGGNLYIKSDTTRTITGFDGAVAHSVYVPFLSTEELLFLGGFGLTISSELMMSSTSAPLKLGSWIFPSTNMPKLNRMTISRLGRIDVAAASVIQKGEFEKIIASGWKDIPRKEAPVTSEEATE